MDDDGQYFNLAVTFPLFNVNHEKKKPFSVTIVITDSDKALDNQQNEGIRFNL